MFTPMIKRHNLQIESWTDISVLMPKEKKISKSYRLNPLAASLVDAEMSDRRKKLGSKAKIAESDIIEECIYRAAALNPKLRDRIITELRKDPRFSAIADSLVPQDKNNAKV